MNKKPLVGISKCLLGEKVRYDGGHKLNHYLKDVLGRYVDFVPVCPEVECGMSIPREAMRLVNINGDIKLLTQKTKKDMTPQMDKWIKEKLPELSKINLCGFIFKSKSPSSGLFRVKVYKEENVSNNGTGIFAKAFSDKFPYLPTEEDGRLNDPKLRENFIERIFIMQRWHKINNERRNLNTIMNFHAEHKYTLMAHDPKSQKELGFFLANTKKQDINTIYNEYFQKFITALNKISTIKKNSNVLLHIMGYFKKDLTKDEKQELVEVINNYHDNLIPLIVPITLLNHYIRKYKSKYLETQRYLNPHPMELMLRNHV